MGDIVHAQRVQLQHPKITAIFDIDQSPAAATRQQLLSKLASEDVLIAVQHSSSKAGLSGGSYLRYDADLEECERASLTKSAATFLAAQILAAGKTPFITSSLRMAESDLSHEIPKKKNLKLWCRKARHACDIGPPETEARFVAELMDALFIRFLPRSSPLIFHQTLDDLASLEERFLFVFGELSDGLRQPGLFRTFGDLAQRGACGGQPDIHLGAVGRMRLSLDRAPFFKCSDGGSHR